MKKPFLFTFFVLAACQSASEAPQSFENLLKITDTTEQKICSLPLTELRRRLSPEEIEAAKTEAFDFEKLILEKANDPSALIRILFRRAALRRRLNVEESVSETAQQFYEALNVGTAAPTTLEAYHDAFHFWADRIQEQSEFGERDSTAYNIRFCIINEKRAELHAASRKEILAHVTNGVSLPAPMLIETIKHETSFDSGFYIQMMDKVFTPENSNALTPLARAKIRADEPFLPFDPSAAETFWIKRDEEILAAIKYIQSHNFSSPADKLEFMTYVDQSLRKLWNSNTAAEHFDNDEEFETFKKGIPARIIKIDEFNTSELRKMLVGRGWFRDDLDGKGAAQNAWLIAQHADRNPEFQIEALGLIEKSFDAPGVSKSNYAYLYDRVQMQFEDDKSSNERLQRYGTQGRCTGTGTWEPFPVEAPNRIDEIRAEVGLGTIADYKSRFKGLCKMDER
ncbi:MAG: DUF6624 domain-containing protein [Maricaulaceae bacterium]